MRRTLGRPRQQFIKQILVVETIFFCTKYLAATFLYFLLPFRSLCFIACFDAVRSPVAFNTGMRLSESRTFELNVGIRVECFR